MQTQIVRSAEEDGVFGIEVDNDIPGRYESFVNPEEKLKAIRAMAQKAHGVGQPRIRLHRRNRMHHGQCR